ncbi:DUF4276 family protein [Winogradskya humida]|uniref:DUF4276 family protein n=1 Tax=Winogradskya humida TaxID=113566 RepID=A0ABQ3ZMK7_9ACTN|nr:DUF4276 family protein [Actinoplanes humidus]GIE19810.1 hypothetical protein Ahu01nite_029120 [Actinoplanes humidus]
MTSPVFDGLFVAEGTSDMPIADFVERLFFERGVELRLSKPDFNRLGRVPKDVANRLKAGELLNGGPFDVVVVHRDADNAGDPARRREIEDATKTLSKVPRIIPVIPVRMTEAWLLLDESEIRFVAGNPSGKKPLDLPKRNEVEARADPKHLLQMALLNAADVKGRRHELQRKRFFDHRRLLLERLDCHGPVTKLSSWQKMVNDVDQACRSLTT